jgi:hypothetical protein
MSRADGPDKTFAPYTREFDDAGSADWPIPHTQGEILFGNFACHTHRGNDITQLRLNTVQQNRGFGYRSMHAISASELGELHLWLRLM